MSLSRHVLVIGAASLDIKGRAKKGLQLRTSTPGTIRASPGGVGRNIADNLARLGQQVVLLSATGDDPFARQLVERTARVGVDVSRILCDPGCPTASYVAIVDREGNPVYAVDQMEVMRAITPAHIRANRALFRDAEMVVLDANLSSAALSAAITTAKRNHVPVTIDPTSATLAPKVRKHLSNLYMVTPTGPEAEVLCERTIQNPTDAMVAVRDMVRRGVEIAIITLAEQGACYATTVGSGYIPGFHGEITDYTGASDALTAAVVYGLVNGFTVDEAMRIGVSAGIITMQCADTVCPDLSLERLYDQMRI